MTPAEELRLLILAAQREGNHQLTEALRPLGLTPSQAEALRLLADHAPLTLNGLGELLVCERGASPSRLVDRLVAAGLVARRPAEEDRRQVLLTLTEAGAGTASRVAELESELHARITAAARPHDLAPVLDLLRSFVAGTPTGTALTRRRETPAS